MGIGVIDLMESPATHGLIAGGLRSEYDFLEGGEASPRRVHLGLSVAICCSMISKSFLV